MHIYILIYLCTYAYIHTHILVYICMYTYTCVHMHIYICIYIYSYMFHSYHTCHNFSLLFIRLIPFHDHLFPSFSLLFPRLSLLGEVASAAAIQRREGIETLGPRFLSAPPRLSKTSACGDLRGERVAFVFCFCFVCSLWRTINQSAHVSNSCFPCKIRFQTFLISKMIFNCFSSFP